MAIIESLTAKLSFDFDKKNLKEFEKGMKSASKAVAVVAGAASVAGAAIFAFTNKIANQNDEIGKTAQRIGVTAQTLNDLSVVAQLGGASVNSMATSLEALGKTSSEAARGLGGGLEAFGILGVSVTDLNGELKQADNLMLDVADAISKLDNQSQKLELLSKLGIDSTLLLTLEQGSDAIRKQRKEVEELGFVLDKDATTAAANFNDEMTKVGVVTKGVASAIGTKLMKVITPMLETFLKWFKANKEIIKQNLTAFFEGLTRTITAIFNVGKRVVGVIDSLVQSFGGWKVAIGAVVVAITALNARVLLIPMLIGALAVGIFALLEDFIVFAKGGDSQLGKLAERFPIIKAGLEGLLTVMRAVRDGWDQIFSNGEKAIQGLKIVINDLIEVANKIPGVNIGKIGGETPTASVNRGVKITQKDIASARQNGLSTSQIVDIVKSAGPGGVAANVTINIDGNDISAVQLQVERALSNVFQSAEQNVSTPIIN